MRSTAGTPVRTPIFSSGGFASGFFQPISKHGLRMLACPSIRKRLIELRMIVEKAQQEFAQARPRFDPIAQRTAGNGQAVTREQVFLPVGRQGAAEHSDKNRSNESWSGDAASNWPHWRARAQHAVFAVPTGVFGSQVHMHLELRRNVLQNSALVLAMRSLLRPQPGHCLSASLRSSSSRKCGS